MSRAWSVRLTAMLVGVTSTLLLSVGHRDVGYVRDEGIYFVASRAYGRWASTLIDAPSEALSPKARDRAFAINREHPPLMKLAAGVSARLLAEPSRPAPGQKLEEPAAEGLFPVLPEGAAMRLPAQLLAGLGAALLVLAGASFGGSLLAGLLAAGWFISLPRVWFNAGLHCFDVPVAVATLALALTYRAALCDRRWALLLGPLLGVAIVIKHNALFLPVLFLVHYGLCLARAGAWRSPKLWLPLGMWSVALGAPLTAFALWPWLWTAPAQRLTEYFEFHRLHAYYNAEFLGINYNRPPLPTELPLVLTWATVPTALLLVAILGLGIALRRDLSKKTGDVKKTGDPAMSGEAQAATSHEPPSAPPADQARPAGSMPIAAADRADGSAAPTADQAPRADGLTPKAAAAHANGVPANAADAADQAPSRSPVDKPPPFALRPRSWAAPLRPEERLDGALLALLAAFPLVLIALPTVPIFGGTKHWLTAYPFLALAAAIAWGALWRHLDLPRRWRGVQALALIVLLIPSTWSTIHSHPFGLSAYAPLVGGTRGAAELGLMRGFWGHAMTPLLPELDALGERQRGRLYIHDLHGLSLRQYIREGRWPAGVKATAANRARAGLLFHERHMLTYELQLWQSLDLVSPQAIVELDDVPLTSLYVAD